MQASTAITSGRWSRSPPAPRRAVRSPDRRACGVGSSLKEGGVDLVNGGEISDIREENGGFDHVIQSQPSCGQNRLDIFHSLRGLSLYAAVCKFTGGGGPDRAGHW